MNKQYVMKNGVILLEAYIETTNLTRSILIVGSLKYLHTEFPSFYETICPNNMRFLTHTTIQILFGFEK